MAKMIRVTLSEGETVCTSDDTVILINSDRILKIDDTDENYAGDSRVQMSDGSAIYVTESLDELEKRINA